MHNQLCPQYLYNCLPQKVSDKSENNLRNNDNYVLPRFRLRAPANSFIPSTVKLWNNLDISTRNIPKISTFKRLIYPSCCKAPEYYGEGSRRLNILHTRLRYHCSSLNADLKRINVVTSPKCSCGSPCEDAYHFFLECPLYLNQRVTLFRDLTIMTLILKFFFSEMIITLMKIILKFLKKFAYT